MFVFGWHHGVDLCGYHLYDASEGGGIEARGVLVGRVPNELRVSLLVVQGGYQGVPHGGALGFFHGLLFEQNLVERLLSRSGRDGLFLGRRQTGRRGVRGPARALRVAMATVNELVRVRALVTLL